MAGAPIGNRNAARGAEWRDALRKALKDYEASGIKRGQALRKIAEKLVEKALEGDMAAIVEIGNRLDGKPAQPVLGQHDLPLTVVFKDVIASRPEGYTRDTSG